MRIDAWRALATTTRDFARALAAVTDTSFQTAAAEVAERMTQGLLPDLGDVAGMRRALDVLLLPAAASTSTPRRSRN
jgi:hypothetical protein